MWCSKLKMVIAIIILFLCGIIGVRFTHQFELIDDVLDHTHHRADGDIVVMLHGIARSKESMEPLSKRLNIEGFEVINIHYPSSHYDINALTQKIDGLLSEVASKDKSMHIVGYSMGGLIARQLIADYDYDVGKVVMIGTPNHGSEVADYYKDWWLYKKMWGPAGQELTTYNNSIPNLPEDVELTVIAGATSRTTAFSTLLPPPSDGTVSVASTRLNPMKNHYTVDATHYRLLMQPAVTSYVLDALK